MLRVDDIRSNFSGQLKTREILVSLALDKQTNALSTAYLLFIKGVGAEFAVTEKSTSMSNLLGTALQARTSSDIEEH